jgi:hypothetical protein
MSYNIFGSAMDPLVHLSVLKFRLYIEKNAKTALSLNKQGLFRKGVKLTQSDKLAASQIPARYTYC